MTKGLLLAQMVLLLLLRWGAQRESVAAPSGYPKGTVPVSGSSTTEKKGPAGRPNWFGTVKQEGKGRQPMETLARLAGDEFFLRVGAHGGLEVERNQERYRLESSYSYPGDHLGWNRLAEENSIGEEGWAPQITQPENHEIRIDAAGRYYGLRRTIRVAGGRVCMADTLTNRTPEDVGILMHHRIRRETPAEGLLIAGTPAPSVSEAPSNPTIFLPQKKSRLGVLAEDTLSRVQFAGEAAEDGASFSLRHFALRSGASRTFRWTLYPLDGAADYFTFINRVRQDWGTNFTVEGPFDFAPSMEVWDNPARLRAYLKRKPLRIAAPGPWLDYDNGWLHLGLQEQREAYKDYMQRAKAALQAVDPNIQVVGNMEGPLVSISPELSRKLWEVLPPDQRGQYYPKPFTEQQLALMQELPISQKDSLVVGPNGETYYELYYRGPQDDRIPLMALLVYPAPGNQQLAFWMEQARFLMEEVGLDGIYLDGGGPVRNGRYGYDRWDGVTVDMDPETGRITRKYTDYMPLIGDAPCRSLFDYVRERGGTMVANGHHYTEEMQSYAIPRFLETGGAYDPLALEDGEKPPLVPAMCLYGHLDAPIALANYPGNYGEEAPQNYARFVMKSVITHLRHGLLYYYYNIEIPETGPGQGEYGPLNSMFPITPLELHEGWILGKERLITARSLEVLWDKEGEPVAHLFDLTGREIAGRDWARIRPQEGRWSIQLQLKDWAEIAVVE